ncbi:MAG: hypothetical protein ACRDZ8_03420 [Acidimicrobiales bacterium]
MVGEAPDAGGFEAGLAGFAEGGATSGVRLEEKAKLGDLASLLNEMLADTGGPLSVAERTAADRALGR